MRRRLAQATVAQGYSRPQDEGDRRRPAGRAAGSDPGRRRRQAARRRRSQSALLPAAQAVRARRPSCASAGSPTFSATRARTIRRIWIGTSWRGRRSPSRSRFTWTTPADVREAIKREACDWLNIGGPMVNVYKLAAMAEAAGIPTWHGSGVDLGIAEAALRPRLRGEPLDDADQRHLRRDAARRRSDRGTARDCRWARPGS